MDQGAWSQGAGSKEDSGSGNVNNGSRVRGDGKGEVQRKAEEEESGTEGKKDRGKLVGRIPLKNSLLWTWEVQ